MKKTILKCTAISVFAVLMAFNITTTVGSTNFSLSGMKALAGGTSGGGFPTCPDPGELTMKYFKCSDGSWNKICRPSGSGCDISGQTTYD